MEHYCERTSPVVKRFGIPQGTDVVISHVLHEDGVRCFNTTYLRDTLGRSISVPPWGKKPPKEI